MNSVKIGQILLPAQIPKIPKIPSITGGAGKGNLNAVKIKPTIKPVPREAKASVMPAASLTTRKVTISKHPRSGSTLMSAPLFLCEDPASVSLRDKLRARLHHIAIWLSEPNRPTLLIKAT